MEAVYKSLGRMALAAGLACLPALLTAQTGTLMHKDVALNVEQCLGIAAQKEREGDKKESTRFLNQAATLLWEQKQYAPAAKHFEKSLVLNHDIGNQNGVSMLCSNLGMLYADMQEYETALRYFEQTYQARKAAREKTGMTSSLVNMAVVLNNLGRHAEAAARLEEALQLSVESSDMQQVRACYGMLTETYEKAGDNARSRQYFNLYRTFHEMEQKTKEGRYLRDLEKSRLTTLLAEADKRNAEAEQRNKELELFKKQQELVTTEEALSVMDKATRRLVSNATKQQLAIRVLERENQIKAITLKQDEVRLAGERRVRNLFAGGLVLIVCFSGLLLRSYQQKKSKNTQLARQNQEITRHRAEITLQKEAIEEKQQVLEQTYKELHKKNDNIVSSINYAKLIQTAILPTAAYKQQLLGDAFVLFKPRDIVSGDFYWMHEKDGLVTVVAADCTGHGVPGAFMSMIGVNLLNQISSRIQPDPARLLQELHREITVALNKKVTDNKDGMDIAVVMVDRHRNTVTFSGAKNPLVCLQDGAMTVFKGDRLTVGGHYDSEEHVFGSTEIAITGPTHLYLYSDGFPDQFGGEKGDKKFSSRRLQEQLLEHHAKPMPEQQALFEATISEWMGPHRQIDDILLLGIRLDPA